LPDGISLEKHVEYQLHVQSERVNDLRDDVRDLDKRIDELEATIKVIRIVASLIGTIVFTLVVAWLTGRLGL
jgi:hypothetical protein